MAKIRTSFDVSKVKEFGAFQRFVGTLLLELGKQLNGGLEFGANIKAKIVSVAFPTADTDVEVVHALGSIPTGYFIASSTNESTFYDGSLAMNGKSIYIRSSAPTTAKVVVF